MSSGITSPVMRDPKRVDQAPDLAAAIGDGLPRLDAQHFRQLVAPLAEPAHAVHEHVAPFERGQRAHRRSRRDRERDRLVVDMVGGERHARRHLTAVLVAHHQVGIGLDGAIGKIVGVSIF
jgi:hypothetical protein